MMTAISPVFVLLLFVALLPMVPLIVFHQPSLAVSAVSDDDGTTRINVHGEASPELAAALDAFVGSLPPGAGRPPSTGPGADAPDERDSHRPPVHSSGSAVAALYQPPVSGQAVVLFDPASSRCREACRILDARGVQISLLRYLEDVPKPADLLRVLHLLGADDPRTIIRTSEPLYTDMGLATASADRLLSAMVEHPILIQRPIVVVGDRAVIARPSERVLELFEPTGGG
jgi:arsenate reductase